MLIFEDDQSSPEDSEAETKQEVSGVVRLSVNISERTAESLKALSESRGENLTDTVTYALSLTSYIEGEVSRGKILMLSDRSRKKFWDIVTA